MVKPRIHLHPADFDELLRAVADKHPQGSSVPFGMDLHHFYGCEINVNPDVKEGEAICTEEPYRVERMEMALNHLIEDREFIELPSGMKISERSFRWRVDRFTTY